MKGTNMQHAWKTDALWALYWMVRGIEVLALVLGLLLLSGCSFVLDEQTAPVVREVIVPTSVDVTSTRARATARGMHATFVEDNPSQSYFTASITAAEMVRVTIERVPEGTRLTVSCMVPPQVILVGMLTCADDFLAAYWREVPS